MRFRRLNRKSEEFEPDEDYGDEDYTPTLYDSAAAMAEFGPENGENDADFLKPEWYISFSNRMINTYEFPKFGFEAQSARRRRSELESPPEVPAVVKFIRQEYI